jgi:hypothetical protein
MVLFALLHCSIEQDLGNAVGIEMWVDLTQNVELGLGTFLPDRCLNSSYDICLQARGEERKVGNGLTGSLRERRRCERDCSPMSQRLVVGELVSEGIEIVKCPLLCGLEHDEGSATFKAPFFGELLTLIEVGGVGEFCHAQRAECESRRTLRQGLRNDQA